MFANREDVLAAHPGLTRVVIIDVNAAGPRLAELSGRAHAAFAERIGRMIEAAAAEGKVHLRDPLMPRALVGAVNEVVTHTCCAAAGTSGGGRRSCLSSSCGGSGRGSRAGRGCAGGEGAAPARRGP